MGAIAEGFASAFRDFVIDGVAASGLYQPQKSAQRDLGALIETAISTVGLGALVDLSKDTRANLNADLAHPANSIALVYGDAIAANNDLYVKVGASGTGSWTLTSIVHDTIGGLSQPYVDAAQDSASLAQTAATEALNVAAVRVGDTGDSIVQRNHATSFGTTFGQTQGVGGMTWARALYPYFEFDVWESAVSPYWSGLNSGISGNTAADVLARLEPISDLAPDIQRISVGVNSISAGTSAATIMSQLEQICAHFTGLGVRVILSNIRPVAASYDGGTWADGSAKMLVKAALNDMIADYCAITPNVTLLDLEAVHTDGGNPPRPKAGHMIDGLHLDRLGGLEEGRAITSLLRKMIKPLVERRPRGINLISNPTMVGGGGTASTGVSGSVGASWLAQRNLGSASIVAGYNANGEQAFTITPGGASAEQFQISRNFGGITVVPGKWYKGYIRIRLSAWAGWRGPYLNFANATYMSALADVANTSVMTVPEDLDLYIETPTKLMPGGVTSVSPLFRMLIDGAAAGTGELTIKEWGLFEVPDPRPLHGL